MPSPLLQRTRSSDLELISASPIPVASAPASPIPAEPVVPGPAVFLSTHVKTPTVITSVSSSYKLVSKTRRTYNKTETTVTTPVSVLPGTRKAPVVRKPLKTDRSLSSLRKRKQQFELLRSQSNCKIESTKVVTPLTVSQSDFTISTNCAHITSSTPIEKRPKKMAGHRRQTSEQQHMDTVIARPQVPSNKMSKLRSCSNQPYSNDTIC